MDHSPPTDPAQSSHVGSWPSLSVASVPGEPVFDPPWISASPGLAKREGKQPRQAEAHCRFWVSLRAGSLNLGCSSQKNYIGKLCLTPLFPHFLTANFGMMCLPAISLDLSSCSLRRSFNMCVAVNIPKRSCGRSILCIFLAKTVDVYGYKWFLVDVSNISHYTQRSLIIAINIYIFIILLVYPYPLVILGKSWACKHWKFQNNYFVIFLHFCCIFFAFGFVILDLCCHFFVIFSFLCHFCVIFLSFVCHFIVILLSFWEWENGEKTLFKNDYHDRPFVISWQHQIQGTSGETLGKPAGGEEG